MAKMKFWQKLSTEILFFLGIFIAFSYWMEKDMLESNATAPLLSAIALDGKVYQVPLATENAKRTLVYFFAPWCNICHLSIGNLNILRSQIDETELAIIIVALDWKSRTEVAEYMVDHDLTFPVLLGNQQWLEQYQIKGFPSYYVLNQKGEILSRSMGYSSALGMIRRSLFK